MFWQNSFKLNVMPGLPLSSRMPVTVNRLAACSARSCSRYSFDSVHWPSVMNTTSAFSKPSSRISRRASLMGVSKFVPPPKKISAAAILSAAV